MQRWKRRRVTVDIPMQGAFCLRVAIYWTACMATAILIFVGRVWFTEAADTNAELLSLVWNQSGGFVIAASLVIPLVLFDVLVMTNRFAGPVYRITQELNKLADGQAPQPVRLRSGDFCVDLANAYNRMLLRVEGRADAPAADGHPSADGSDNESGVPTSADGKGECESELTASR